jgi:hypothetical protein
MREPERLKSRPFLPDPGDEFLLELAVSGGADALVTHNIRHFAGVERFGGTLVSVAVANRLASREYIESRAKLFNRDEFERALNEIPDVKPENHDSL